MKELTSMCYVTGLQCCNNVWKCFSHILHMQWGRNPITSDVRTRSAGLLVGRVKTMTLIPRLLPGNIMDSTPGRRGPSVQNLGQTDGWSVCFEGQFQNSNWYISSSKTKGMESQQPGTVMEKGYTLMRTSQPVWPGQCYRT
jgi:hypothetical protein